MIIPVDDVATPTDEEIITAYVALGFDEESAGVYLAVLRNPDPRFEVD
ncbi:hypothetical protein [Agromyces bauzanensis]